MCTGILTDTCAQIHLQAGICAQVPSQMDTCAETQLRALVLPHLESHGTAQRACQPDQVGRRIMSSLRLPHHPILRSLCAAQGVRQHQITLAGEVMSSLCPPHFPILKSTCNAQKVRQLQVILAGELCTHFPAKLQTIAQQKELSR